MKNATEKQKQLELGMICVAHGHGDFVICQMIMKIQRWPQQN